MDVSSLRVDHPLVEALPQEWVCESIVNIELGNFHDLQDILRDESIEHLLEFLPYCMLEWVDLIQCLDIEDIADNARGFEEELLEARETVNYRSIYTDAVISHIYKNCFFVLKEPAHLCTDYICAALVLHVTVLDEFLE